jgi:arylsulfatase
MNAYENTVILFLSDNGASSEQLIRADGHDPSAAPGSAKSHLCLGPGWSSAANTPFRLHKSWVHEGGIASPLIVHWPEGIRDAGKLRHTPCHFIDILPTLLELGGADPAKAPRNGAPALPGRSLVPAVLRDVKIRREYLYFHHANNRALRIGDRKIVAAGVTGPWELYDIRSDRSEMKNLAAAQPDRVEAMAARWRDIDRGYVRSREDAVPFPKDAPGLQRLAGRDGGGAAR